MKMKKKNVFNKRSKTAVPSTEDHRKEMLFKSRSPDSATFELRRYISPTAASCFSPNYATRFIKKGNEPIHKRRKETSRLSPQDTAYPSPRTPKTQKQMTTETPTGVPSAPASPAKSTGAVAVGQLRLTSRQQQFLLLNDHVRVSRKTEKS